jgi:hypothetical protein
MLLLGAMIGAGIFGIDTRASLAYQVFAITSSILLISFISSFFFKIKLNVERNLPEFGTVAMPMNYKVKVENPHQRPHRDLIYMDELAYQFPSYETFRSTPDPQDMQRNWVDRKIGYPRLMSLIQKNRGGSMKWTDIDVIPAGDETQLAVEFLPLRRGYLHFAKSSIAKPDPFGLFRSISSKDVKEKLLILPKTYNVPRITLEGRRRYHHGGISQASQVGDSQEFMSLREYKPGDPLRSIHWRSYAKRGKPVVKEYRDEFFVRQGLILDTFIENHSQVKFEEAVSIAASFALCVEERDALLDLMFVGTESYHFTSGRSFGKAANMLEILACVEPSSNPDFNRLNKLIEKHISELSSMVVILLDWDDKRQDMIKHFISLKIPIMVFVLKDNNNNGEPFDPGPLAMNPERFVEINIQDVQQALDDVDWRAL